MSSCGLKKPPKEDQVAVKRGRGEGLAPNNMKQGTTSKQDKRKGHREMRKRASAEAEHRWKDVRPAWQAPKEVIAHTAEASDTDWKVSARPMKSVEGENTEGEEDKMDSAGPRGFCFERAAAAWREELGPSVVQTAFARPGPRNHGRKSRVGGWWQAATV
ncbi:hypothetical protein ERJ75_001724400 [Trypanosoma vivax]|nr:hypothetical protein ERJ75_001724400 [Trypanosoma vivax]